MRPIYSMQIVTIAILMTSGQGSYAIDEPYYTWVDPDGVVNYSQQKPSGIEATLIRKKPRFNFRGEQKHTKKSSVNSTPKATPKSEDSVVKAQRLEEESERKIKAIISANKQADCERAKMNLEKYTNRGRIRLRGEDGEYRILPDDEKQDRIRKFNNELDKNC